MCFIRIPAIIALIAGLWLLCAEPVNGQTNAFSESEIVKIESVSAAEFQRRFRSTRWTGQGMQGITDIDRIPSMELRARFQTVFGDPTRVLDDLVFQSNFRMAEAIQYEYWFIVNDQYPMMILDIDGPFARGLVYAVSVSYIDLMPQIKRVLSAKLMEPSQLDEYTDIFYSPERNTWFEIRYENGEFGYSEVSRPERFRRINLN